MTKITGYITEQAAKELVKAHEEWHKAWVDDVLVTSEVVNGLRDKISVLEDIIKLLNTQIVERDDLLKRVYERIDSEVLRKEVDNIIPKWYDNIPEHGVLCWVGEHLPLTKNANSLRTIVEYDSDRGCGFIMYRTEAIIASWTHAVPLTNEEIEEFKR